MRVWFFVCVMCVVCARVCVCVRACAGGNEKTRTGRRERERERRDDIAMLRLD